MCLFVKIFVGGLLVFWVRTVSSRLENIGNIMNERMILCGPKVHNVLNIVCGSYNHPFNSRSDVDVTEEDNNIHGESAEVQSNIIHPNGVADECCSQSCTLQDLRGYCNFKDLTDEDRRQLEIYMNVNKDKKVSRSAEVTIETPIADDLPEMTLVDIEYEPMAIIRIYSSPEFAARVYDTVDRVKPLIH